MAIDGSLHMPPGVGIGNQDYAHRPLNYYSGHKIVPIIRADVSEDALCALLVWEPLNSLSNKIETNFQIAMTAV